MNIGSVYYMDSYFGPSTGIIRISEVKNMDLLIFWGGGDISPMIYGHQNVASGGISSKRDAIEVSVMEEALRLEKPILGICRGAQLACAMLGGTLYQDVDGHTSTHDMVIAEPYQRFAPDPTIRTSSLHHQMMRPTEEMEIIATAPGRSRYRKGADETTIGHNDDPEVLYHPKKHVLMVQGHPEYLPKTSALTQFTRNLVQNLLGVRFND